MLQRPDVAPPTKLTVCSPSLRLLADQKIDYLLLKMPASSKSDVDI